ncbi:polyhydroxyalkanoate depolymerase [Siccirubricoccus sp. KC 17139]|uniref:Polyhydroxyalkanoate depolymerase n=1 Tax=Siccirubricoccus soli TaxID=2899147 RepID=A0ABT1D0T0_9PROT|nr:polyhydroxyalkanoate depolymerase [Siccirubricoccus soli]MCO6415482.1 polyhydroxyalkanoate depolymerase [Siccirubricoccus soli]MCP2681614.1 polyhydroxyalkanoate depolymerase [Siccirubricoccus soli]
MIYTLFQARQDMLTPLRRLARGWGGILSTFEGSHPAFFPLRAGRAALEVFADFALTHRRPEFGITSVSQGNEAVAVQEVVAQATPFASLTHFRTKNSGRLPRVLVVAPMSGHFATLLRNTVQVLLQDHDVYITDWHNARDVPLTEGRFGFDEYVEHIMEFLRLLGPGAHVLAVCQPVAAVLAAVALMAEDRDRATPRSMTLMAGPIDARVKPTKVNDLANSKSIQWFERNLISTVPWRHRGGGRRVYPGAVQLTAFMAMNAGRHARAHHEQFLNILDGETAKAEQHRRFYEEYFAVMDLPAEFYLETVATVFQRHDLPLGKLAWRGRRVRPEAIRRTAIMTVEGEKDDICGIGQTMAALDLCRGVPVTMKRHHLQTGVGHYGVFSGRRWALEIYPRVREMIQAYSDAT